MGRFVFWGSLVLSLAACGGGGDGAPSGTSAASGAAPTGSVPAQATAAVLSIQISGTAATGASVGNWYSFQPSVTASQGQVRFSIQNAPSWASFDAATGELSGAPDAEDVGVYEDIVISASDGTKTVALAPYTLHVTGAPAGSVALSWVPPLRNTDGTAIDGLAGYHIYYGRESSSMTQSVDVSSPTARAFELANLGPGRWFVSVVAYTSEGVDSKVSAIIEITV